ncbi:hypothetical protein UFOVP1601_48 [uncultured Caudovirales phage]|uniref:Uncharacterized protein n=1 Tax=uncultured Caudovirales phage TaxID=2100421 RepID=A0A6J5SUA1_9CAUD|nr:hypothetical protein UFOVP1154_2 [uncultured Caudovirales phage]CAB4200378.1 hypothetical protein UFOVP1341_35 [uncultured Caudovirales phage]CAB4218899.1 hypothetical protein UFOVP1601_48 [uncultured Caudovirales phage]
MSFFWGSGKKKLDVDAAYAKEMSPFLTPGATYTSWNENTKRMEPVDVNAIGRQKMTDLQRVRASQDSFDKKMKFFQAAAYAIPTAGLALTAAGVGAPAALAPGAATPGAASAAAANSGWGMSGVTAPTFGAPAAGLATGSGGTVAPIVAPAAKSGIASLLGKPGVAPAIINSGAALLQQRSQNKATNEATRLTLAGNAEALKLQREQLEAETRNADLDREELRAQNAAINELKRRELAAAEEVRAFDREQALYLRSRNETEDRRLAAQEARREPYRQAGQASLSRLMSMWGM